MIQIQTLKNSSTQRVSITKTITLLNLLTMPKRKPTNLNCIRGSPKAKTHSTLIANLMHHWAPDCPDKTESQNDKGLSYEAIIFQADFNHPSELKGPLSEIWNAAILDSGSSKTMCGPVWLDSYIDFLSKDQKANVFQASSSIYCFKNGKTFKATKKIKIPAEIVSHKVMIIYNQNRCYK